MLSDKSIIQGSLRIYIKHLRGSINPKKPKDEDILTQKIIDRAEELLEKEIVSNSLALTIKLNI